MILGDPPIRAQVQRRVEQELVDAFQRQSSLAAFANESQDRVGVPHLTYRFRLGPR